MDADTTDENSIVHGVNRQINLQRRLIRRPAILKALVKDYLVIAISVIVWNPRRFAKIVV
jgi:hypothetical protein